MGSVGVWKHEWNSLCCKIAQVGSLVREFSSKDLHLQKGGALFSPESRLGTCLLVGPLLLLVTMITVIPVVFVGRLEVLLQLQ